MNFNLRGWKALLAVFAVTVWIVGLPAQGHATVLTFDDLPSSDVNTLLTTYGGLTWNNFYLGSITSMNFGNYPNAATSNSQFIFNGSGQAASVVVASGTFTFNSAEMTSAWLEGLSVTVTGYNGTTEVDTTTFTLNTDSAPVLETFNWSGLTSLDFSSAGGTPIALYDNFQGTQFTIDNFTINATPEPSSLTVLVIAAVGLGGCTWRRRKTVRLQGASAARADEGGI